ncbi:MAG: hypothetical protein Q4B11_09130 [Corynebacterium durum]|nr:hypothetical protein [Corynebacterium durum]
MRALDDVSALNPSTTATAIISPHPCLVDVLTEKHAVTVFAPNAVVLDDPAVGTPVVVRYRRS